MGLKLIGLFSLLIFCCGVKAKNIEGDCEGSYATETC